MEFVRDNCKSYKKYIRIHPYLSYDKFPLIYFKEAAQRPVDPNWIKKLELYKGQKTGGHYFLYPVEKVNNEIDGLIHWEYSILRIRSLEIYTQRNNFGNLSMMIEELRKYKEFNEYFVSKCIHLDTDGDIGVKIDSEIFDMSTLFWTYFYRTIYINSYEFVCNSKIIYLFQSRVNKLAIAAH